MNGFRFLTVSVAPHPCSDHFRQTYISSFHGSWIVFQSRRRKVGCLSLVHASIILFSQGNVCERSDHPLALNLSFSISLGLLPATLSLKIAGCGIKYSGLQDEETEDVESNTIEFLFFFF
ncbi:uncharacterized protein LOC133033560 [Cannabis sativa]|uniref:uncharacterized protein LOC133033560 n=1 Tax=Cannabis sativa TaxID=3483 RepID=UPI0029CA66AB|nr:uncharacterized protein LOC133033560 [Cannabis sativa]